MIHPCDRETDRRTYRQAIAYTRYSIYAVARKNSHVEHEISAVSLFTCKLTALV